MNNLLETIRHHTEAGYAVLFLPVVHDGVIAVTVLRGKEAHCNRSVNAASAGGLLEHAVMYAINDAVTELKGMVNGKEKTK